MAEEPDNLVLEHLRNLRAEMAAMSTQISTFEDKVDRGFTTLSQRLDTLQTEVRGVTYVVTASIGSVLADINDLRERVTRLEEA